MTRGLRICVAAVFLFILYRITLRLVARAFGKRGKEATSRAATIHGALAMTLRIVFFLALLLFVLPEFGFQVGPLIASLGIIGLAITFGAQTLVRDIVSGFFLLVEDLCRVGEEVELEKVKGRVEALRFRTLCLRNADGALVFVPYGEIKMLVNFSRR